MKLHKITKVIKASLCAAIAAAALSCAGPEEHPPAGEGAEVPGTLAVQDRESGLFGYIDRSGDFAISPRFDLAWDFAGARALVKKGDKYGYIDQSGEFVVEPRFDEAWDFSEGLAAVETGGRVGYIDESGGTVIEPRFIDAGSFSEGRAWFFTEENGVKKWGFIDKEGEIVIEPVFDWAFDFSNGRALIGLGGRMNFIDPAGELLLKGGGFVFALPFREGMAVGRGEDGLWRYIDENGKVLIKGRFEEATPFSEDLAPVKIDGKWGYIDRAGKTAIEADYEAALPFSEGLAPVKVGPKWGFIDNEGGIMIDPRFDRALPFAAGGAPVELEGTWGAIDRTGEIIIEPGLEEGEYVYRLLRLLR